MPILIRPPTPEWIAKAQTIVAWSLICAVVMFRMLMRLMNHKRRLAKAHEDLELYWFMKGRGYNLPHLRRASDELEQDLLKGK